VSNGTFGLIRPRVPQICHPDLVVVAAEEEEEAEAVASVEFLIKACLWSRVHTS
jgi:hypothetical protein